MAEVIEGLKVTVLGAEVAELAKKQTEFHQGRCAHYEKHLGIYKAEEDSDSDSAALYTSTQDPKSTLLGKLKEHRQKADHMTFIAEHVKAEAEYLLDNSALATLGVIKGSAFGFR